MLGALMTFLITGSAFAYDDIEFNGNDVENSEASVTVNSIYGSVYAKTASFTGRGTVTVINSDEYNPVDVYGGGTLNLGTEDKPLQSVSVTPNTTDGWAITAIEYNSTINIYADTLEINGAQEGIQIEAGSTGNIIVDNFVSTNSQNAVVAYGGAVNLGKENTAIKIKIDDGDSMYNYKVGIYSLKDTDHNTSGQLNVKAKSIDIEVQGNSESSYGISAQDGSAITINADTMNIKTVASDDSKWSGGISSFVGGQVEINAQALNIDASGSGDVFGIHTQNNDENLISDKVAKVTINADEINVKSSDVGLSAFSGSTMEINGNLTVDAVNAIDTRGNSTININTDGAHTTVLKGDIVLETPNTQEDPQGSGKIISSNVNINFAGEESSLTGRIYQEYAGQESIGLEADDYYGEMKNLSLTFSDGATWNVTGDSFVNTLEANDGVVNLGENAVTMNVATLAGDAVTFNTDSVDSKVNIDKNKNSDVTVAAGAKLSAEVTDANEAEMMQAIANVVEAKDGEDKKTVTTQETEVAGARTAVTDANGNITTITEAPNTTNAAISNMANIALMTWRQENNDMNKRLGELRASKGEHGVWVRMTRGESKYNSIKNQYNAYQLGYDEKLSSNPNWTLGAAYTYTDGESSFAGGRGENDHKGFAIYGSYLADDGSFLDLIAKYSRLSHDFEAVKGAGNGDYDTNGYSVSAEYGKRFTKDNGFWIEPQVELTYGKVSSATYRTSNDVQVRQDDLNSFVGRLGFALGKDLAAEKGNVYLRASYLYDFDGDTEMTFAKSGVTRKFEQDLGGGWWEVGVGANINMSKASHLYLDVEKTYGGDVATPWQWNVGVRYSF